MSEADGNSTERSRDRSAVLRASALVMLVTSLAALPGSSRQRLDQPTAGAVPRGPAGRTEASAAGQVLGDDGRPIGGARVVAVLLRDGRSLPLGDTRTEPSGRFHFGPIPPGEVQFVVSSPGRTRALLRTRVEGVTLVPTLVLGEGRRIEGSLQRRAMGEPEPLFGAWVRATREGGADEPPFVTRSDARGHFLLDGLPAGGTWRIEVEAPGHEALRRLGVTATTGTDNPNLALVARALATVEGIVRDAHGEGAPTAVVTISGSGIWPTRTVPVLHDGRFLLGEVPAGVYEVRASRDDDVAEPIAPLVLDPGERREIALALAPGGTIAGTVREGVTGGGVAGARVVLTEDSISVSPRALRTDEGGRFRVPGLLRRAHQVAVHAPGYAPRQGVVARPGEALEVVLDRGVSITGRVVDGQGAPIAHARVELTGEDLDGRALWWNGATVAFRDALFSAQAVGPRPLIARGELGVTTGRVPLVPLVPVPLGVEADRGAPGWTTDVDGRFQLTDVPPGLLRLAATHPAYVRAEAEARSARPGESLEFTLVARAGGAVEGRVLTERGFPLAGAQLELRADTEMAPRRLFAARDGSFRAGALLGRVTLVAWLQGRVAARAEVVVADGATVPVNLTVPGALRRVEGRVTDARGFPVAGATIAITSLERAALGTVQTFSEADGTFDTVVGGTRGLSLEVRHPDHAPRGLRVDDPSRPLRIELSPGAAVGLRPEADGCATGAGRAELRSACGPVGLDARDGEELRFTRVCAGRATLLVEIPGCLRAERSVTVPVGGEVELGRVEVRAGGAAAGEVLDAEGDPVVGALVGPEGAMTVRTGRRGDFVHDALPEGDIDLMATHPALGTSRAVRVRVLRGTTARGVVLRMERGSREVTRVVRASVLAFDEVPARGGGREVLVRSVVEGSTAAQAGVRAGDRVIAVNAEPVETAREAETRLTGVAGDEVVLELERDGQRRTVRFVRESR